MGTRSNEGILGEAARWHSRLGAPDCTELERAACRRWQLRDPAHARAFLRAQRVDDDIVRLAALDGRMQALADTALEPPHRKRHAGSAISRWRWAAPAALAACVLAAVVSVDFIRQIGQPVPEPMAYSTASGERRNLTLADGSIVHLDVDTKLGISMTPTERRIELIRGRALFEVAHDASRPFSVWAGDGTVTALGTCFQVERSEGRMVVTLAEGTVAVAGGADHHHEELQPGEQLSYSRGDAQAWRKREVDPQFVTSWSRGRHVFRGTPLAEALEEVNRYAGRKVRLGDPELGTLPVGGSFIIGDSDLVVSAFAAVLPIRIVDTGGGELILFRRYDALSESDYSR